MRNLTFFDTAAALIPVLLLGGAVTERLRRREQPGEPSQRQATLVYVFLFLFPVAAETAAIVAALSDRPGTLSIWIVVLAVSGGTWALAAALTWPWLRIAAGTRLWQRVVFTAVLVGIFAISTSALLQAVDVESLRADLAEQEENSLADRSIRFGELILTHADAEERVVEARLAAGRISARRARAELLDLARFREKIAAGTLRGEINELFAGGIPDEYLP